MSYSITFLEAIPHVFEHEGGYNNVKSDLGGATNWGVSLRFLKSINKDIDGDGDVDYLDIQKLSKEDATEIYYNNFWKPFYDKLPRLLASKVFDTGINVGVGKAAIILQRALVSLGSKITVDGAVGNATLQEVSKCQEEAILDAYSLAQKNYYDAVIKANPEQIKFKSGWYNRASWQPK